VKHVVKGILKWWEVSLKPQEMPEYSLATPDAYEIKSLAYYYA
jgi:hypothetical protein